LAVTASLAIPFLVMALSVYIILLSVLFLTADCTPARRGGKKQNGGGPVTCPGFPGYCSESYPGDTCLVVCARGRNNVPECQDDGTWTDVPRCIEHEPGIEEQVPGVCPGIPGYCSLDTPGGLCTFECPNGPAIRSTCTTDGTWEPYPTCQGDPRETQDGCNPCPGPLGAFRNRTAEASGGNYRQQPSRVGGKTKKQPSRVGGNNRQTPPRAGGNNGRNIRNKATNNNRNNNFGNNRNKAATKSRSNNPRKNHQAAGGLNRENAGQSKGRPNTKKTNRPAPQPRSGEGFSGKNSLSCPGAVLQACIDVCPGFSARVFAACVGGCAKRCPDSK